MQKGTGGLTKAVIYNNCAIISIYFKESQEGGNLWSTQKVSNVKLMLQVIYEAIKFTSVRIICFITIEFLSLKFPQLVSWNHSLNQSINQLINFI